MAAQDEGTRDHRFTIGEGYALYRGPMAPGSPHAHAAFQLAVAVGGGEVGMVNEAGLLHHGPALVVSPMAPHRMVAPEPDDPRGPGADLLTYFVDPQCAFADRLRARYGPGVVVAAELRGLREEEVRPDGARRSSTLDARLVAAMEAAADRNLSMPDLAARVGVSPQRLRALARAELGMPLPRWRMWARLRRAAEALVEGQSLAEAAVTGGFTDQAHFTRRMHEMLGVTPASVLPVLRGQARRAV
ncbi:helix-turn-helix transcriptional regulator [Streptomyces sp. NPDC002690]